MAQPASTRCHKQSSISEFFSINASATQFIPTTFLSLYHNTNRTILFSSRKAQEQEEQQNAADLDTNQFELSVLERNVCKENFAFYDKARQGWVERFELP